MASRALPRRSPRAASPVDASIPLYQQVRYRGLLTVAVMGASVMQIRHDHRQCRDPAYAKRARRDERDGQLGSHQLYHRLGSGDADHRLAR